MTIRGNLGDSLSSCDGDGAAQSRGLKQCILHELSKRLRIGIAGLELCARELMGGLSGQELEVLNILLERLRA